MVSNTVKQIGIIATISLLLSACTPGTTSIIPDHKAENLIGIPLNKHSKLQSSTEDDSDKVVIFDKTIKKIHHFNLDSTEHLGSYEVAPRPSGCKRSVRCSSERAAAWFG